MANALYPKLALTNLGKNKSTYFPYMLTLSLIHISEPTRPY